MKSDFKHKPRISKAASMLCILFMLLSLLPVTSLRAQEFKCQLTVNAQKISGVDPSVFQTMQTSLNEMMNTRAWTNDVFAPEERIDCIITVQILDSPSQDVYDAKFTVQSARPVFNSNYSSPMFNFPDNDCQITYVQNQSLDFNANQYTNNLTSILGFYAYILIAIDYESFAKGGGEKYFSIAEQIMNNVPTNAPDAKGWRPYDGQRNRYWLINNLQSSRYSLFKEALWDYHYAGMDNFYDKPELARKNIMNALDKLDKIAKDDPNAILLSVFAQAKSDELVGIFSGADMDEKNKAVTYLHDIDPSNASKYDKMTKN